MKCYNCRKQLTPGKNFPNPIDTSHATAVCSKKCVNELMEIEQRYSILRKTVKSMAANNL